MLASLYLSGGDEENGREVTGRRCKLARRGGDLYKEEDAGECAVSVFSGV